MRLSAIPSAALVAVLTGCASGEPAKGDLLVTADRVFDGTRVVERGAVLVRERLVFLSAGGWIVIERGKANLPVQ